MGARRTIGLTGDVGAGKSSVLAWLAARGAATLDADAVVHAILAGDASVADEVVARFGPSIRRAEGGVDRAALAARVFGDAAALADLERIVHPAVVEAARRWLEGVDVDVAVVEAVKLIESGMDAAFGEVWLVVCDGRIRRARLAARGWADDEVARRMAAQPPLGPRLARADVVVDNSGTWAATERQLARVWGPPRGPVKDGQRPRAVGMGAARRRE